MATFDIKMPKLGESITEGTIMSWSVKVGDTVQENDILFEVNTAKVGAEIPSPVSGTIKEIRFKEGDTVAIGTVVAVVDMGGEKSAESAPTPKAEQSQGNPPTEEQAEKQDIQADTPAPKTEQSKEAPPTEKPQEKQASTPTNSPETGENNWYSPAVLQKAQEAGISKEELESISGTGADTRVTKKDVELYITRKKRESEAAPQKAKNDSQPIVIKIVTDNEKPKPEAAPLPVSGEDEVIEMNVVRHTIADRMMASKNIAAHVTTVVEVDVTKLAHWREHHKEEFKHREGINLTFMPAITEAVSKALIDFPRVNSSVNGYQIIQKKHINIGIAVSLDDGNLIVPVIKDADKLSFSGLAVAIDSLAAKARQNKLKLDEVQGGTFSITNYGSFKNIIATPIINQPEIAILGVGYVRKEPAVVETPDGDTIAIRHKMYLSLSFDHRVLDGALGGMFVKRIADYLENWEKE